MFFPYMFVAAVLFAGVSVEAQEVREFKITPQEDVSVKMENGSETVYDKKGGLFSGAVVLTDEKGRNVTYFYRGGKREGRAFSRFEDGNPEMAVDYSRGAKNGDAIYFYAGGKRRLKQTYKDNVLNGEEIVYYENGKPHYQRNYKDGKLDGEAGSFDEDGNIVKKETYKDGIKNGAEYIIAGNMLKEQHNYLNGKYDGMSKIYNDKNMLEEEISYRNGIRDGISKKYKEDGSYTEIPYVKGKKDGVAKAYYSDGKTAEKVSFFNGVKEGKSEIFYKNGQLREIANYKGDKKEGISRKYEENGELFSVSYFVNGSEMAKVNIRENTELDDIYRAYRLGTLGRYSTRKSMWYPVLWLGLNLENAEILEELKQNMEMYAVTPDDVDVYEKESKTKFAGYNRELFFGLNPLSYAINLASPAEILQRFATNSAEIERKNPRDGTALQEAIRLDNQEAVRFLLRHKADIVSDFAQSGSVLFYAYGEKVRPEVMVELLDAGADINAKDEQGHTILMRALQNKDNELAELLLTHNADTSVRVPDGSTMLAYAYECGADEKILDKLFAVGTDVNEKYGKGELLLTEALKKNDSDFVKKLLTKGADINLTDASGYNAAALVLEPELNDNIPLIYEKNVNLKKNIPAEKKALWQLLTDKHKTDLLEKQFAAQQNIREPDENGTEPLREMLQSTDEEMRRLALSYVSQELLNQNPEYIRLALDTHNLLLWKEFVAKGFNPEIKAENGDTFLLYLLKNDYSGDFIRALEELKPDVNAADSENMTPLEISLRQKNIGQAKDFIERGADINRKKNGLPYLAVLGASATEQTKLLLDSGAATDFIAADGKTLLMFAVENLNETLASAVLKNKPEEVDVRDKNGSPAFIYLADAALKNKNLSPEELKAGIKNMARLLQENGANPNVQGSSGETVLVRLAQLDKGLYGKLAETFIEAGVDEKIPDQYRKTAADYAK